jgi:alpha-1,6-mannosyltransferase
MRYCDLTLAYTETSGGIRTYIDQKRRHILEQSDDEHVLIVPGERDRCSRDGRLTKVELESPQIPGCKPYRFFWRPAVVRRALEQTQPDIVELGSFFVSPWAAFHYRERRQDAGAGCLVSAYFHTDIADAYVGAPLRRFLAEGVEEISTTLAQWGNRLSEILENGAEATFGQIFRRCDLTFAATAAQAARIADYGVAGTAIVPLGVDLGGFRPEAAAPDWRRGLGIADDDVLLIYCGRLDVEKAVPVLLDAYERLPPPGAATSAGPTPRFRLIMMGEGPLRGELEARAARLPGVRVLPFEADRRVYAGALAAADIYVTAGPHETFGLSVIEAEACGLPIVGVDSGALRERVQPDWGRLGPIHDAAAMATNILEVTPRRQAMGAAARRHVIAAGYGWERTFETLFDIYERAYAARCGGKLQGQE